MAQFHNHELEYNVEDNYDMTDFDDNSLDEDTQSQKNGIDESLDSDLEDDFDLTKPKTDTSALEARNGKDIQGIPWERLNFTRDKYRETRLNQYKNYENLSRCREELEKECKQVEKGHNFYDFQFNTRLVKSTIVHFQASIDIAVELDCCQHNFVASCVRKNGEFYLMFMEATKTVLALVLLYART